MSIWLIIFWVVVLKIIFLIAMSVYYSLWEKNLSKQEEVIKKDHLVKLCTKK